MRGKIGFVGNFKHELIFKTSWRRTELEFTLSEHLYYYCTLQDTYTKAKNTSHIDNAYFLNEEAGGFS